MNPPRAEPDRCEPSHHLSLLDAYERLPQQVQATADRSFAQLKSNPAQASLALKPVGRFWSARVGLRYRALAVQDGETLIWFWIGSHADYDRLLG